MHLMTSWTRSLNSSPMAHSTTQPWPSKTKSPKDQNNTLRAMADSGVNKHKDTSNSSYSPTNATQPSTKHMTALDTKDSTVPSGRSLTSSGGRPSHATSSNTSQPVTSAKSVQPQRYTFLRLSQHWHPFSVKCTLTRC